MSRYIVHRALQAVPLVFGVVIVNFLIIHLAPGDPVQALVGDFPAPAAYVNQVRKEFGLDRPLLTQLGMYIEQITRGNLGYSFAQRRLVRTVVAERIGPTLLLMGTAWTVAGAFGLVLGTWSSLRAYSTLDHSITVSSLLGFSLPVFWLGQILILLFAVALGWLPAQGMTNVREEFTGGRHLLDLLAHLALPALALSTSFLAMNTRLTRSSMIEVFSQDYITTARAKGLGRLRVLVHHALRNALLPVVTIMGFNLGFLFGGSVLVETVFAWPGIGRLMFDSLATRDYPVILGIFLVVAMTVVIANLLTDVAYAWLDPRVRY